VCVQLARGIQISECLSLAASGLRMPEKSRAPANDIMTLECSRANYICQPAPAGHRNGTIMLLADIEWNNGGARA